ncbi:hypothetical protein [Streptomyces olivochromogenes]|uniref:Uncharacterized protein n=1 Tax=Streptomyces olivochromogenes TaxID=1963 RepID=A0A250VFM5_STROL|nr:hypothetical protein [Streptomyces olivochromogenes]KUN47444.1 hypothetical protein AQJ27_10940 [Streptomyces olivochromogenes]GAX52862.1 hypothetical protein SO3561_04381 [Streptomyces olivochromogenes]
MTFNTPASAAENGLPGNLDAINHASQLNQFLGTPHVNVIYHGTEIVTADPVFSSWTGDSTPNEYTQPFTMPIGHTSIGRVTVPVRPVGAGADLFVALYPDDGSGNPKTSSPLASTVVPASWITDLAGETTVNGGSPNATALFNNIQNDNLTLVPWSTPLVTSSSELNSATTVPSGNYIILAGGGDLSGNSLTDVVLVFYDGDVPTAVPATRLPVGLYHAALAATSSTVAIIGGSTSVGSGFVSTTYTASWDPNTGALGAWSQQASLPVALREASSWGHTNSAGAEMIYVAGGTTNTGMTAVNTVYYTPVSNGQLTGWVAAPSLPTAVFWPVLFAVNDWLFCAGGLVSGGASATNASFYAKINDDGSIGSWLPTNNKMRQAVGSFTAYATTGNGAIVAGGLTDQTGPTFVNGIQTLTVYENGPGEWQISADVGGGFDLATLVVTTEDTSDYVLFLLGNLGGVESYVTIPEYNVPTMSVPLSVSGLTAGSTYHVFMRQTNQPGPGNDPTSYLEFLKGSAGLPSPFKSRSRYGSGAWTADTFSLNVSVYDQTAGGNFLHFWQDPSSSNLAAATSTFAWSWQGQLLGCLEAILFPNDPLNSNPTFVSGTSPWTATNCTLTQSNAQVHGGFTESGLITPNGTSATVYASSELMSVTPGHWYQAQGWLYSPPGWSNVSLSVNWFDASQTYLATSSNTVSLAAATWTQQVNNFQAPNGAAYATLVPTEDGTPSAATTLFLSNLTLANADPSALASVAQLNRDNPTWPPTGLTQLD